MKIEEMYGIINDDSIDLNDYEQPWTASNVNVPQLLDCDNASAQQCFNAENSMDWLEYSSFNETRWVTAEVAEKHGLKPDMEPVTLKANVDGNILAQDFYNLEQLSGHSYPSVDKPQPAWQTNVDVERLVDATGIKVFNNAVDSAYYIKATDEIHLPHQSQFATPEKYYQTLLHELSHATGHEKRLDRDSLRNAFTDNTFYAQEEVTAEFSSLIMCKEFGIEPDSKGTFAYTKGWAQGIERDQTRSGEQIEQMKYAGLENVHNVCNYLTDINKDLKLQTIKEAYDKAKQTKGKSADLGTSDSKRQLNPLSGADKAKATKDTELKSSLGETKLGESSVLSAYEKAKNKTLSKVTKGINPKGKGFDR
jgi:hypothetical protein